MEQQKKKRGENWSYEEKEILRHLIAQSAHIIEDRSTKTSVNMQKTKEWKNIQIKFNELSGKCRSDGELKLAWKRMKLSAKSNLSTHRSEQSKTGGGRKPPSPSPEDLEIMAIAPHDFVIEVNDYDSDALNPVPVPTVFTDPKPGPSFEETEQFEAIREEHNYIHNPVSVPTVFTDPKPGPSFEETDQYDAIHEENPEHQFVEVQDTESTRMKTFTNNETDNTRSTTKKRKKSLQNRTEEMRNSIIQSNTGFKRKQLEMMEVEHKYNVKIANLKIKKLELEIAILESKKHTNTKE